MFKYSARSRERMVGVHPDLVIVSSLGLSDSLLDWTVLEGLRNIQTQRTYVANGWSTTLDSYHLTGDALDLGAWVMGDVSLDWSYYVKIAYAMRKAAIETGIRIRWGGGWFILNDVENLEKAKQEYVARKRAQGKRPFLDGVHFQRESRS